MTGISETIFSPQVVTPAGITAGIINVVVIHLPVIINVVLVIYLILAVIHKLSQLKQVWDGRNEPSQ